MAILEVSNIHKKFGKTEVLKGIDFSQNEGEVISVIGSSGSGKTTLLRCITGLETADIGKITVDGRVTFDAERREKLSKDEKRENQLCTGLVFQSFNLFPQYTVLRNVTLACELLIKENSRKKKLPHDEKKKLLDGVSDDAKKVIDSVGLLDKLSAYPCELSGGQQQRVAIARALMLSPKILCFDEPTSALDPEITGEVLNVIKKLADDGRTMLIVTHEMGFAREVSDKVIYMHEGVIAEEGTPTEVFDNPQNERLQAFLSSTLHI